MTRRAKLGFYAAVLAMGCSWVACSSAQPVSAAGASELLAALSSARARGCSSRPGTPERLAWSPTLGQASRRIARGASAQDATRAVGYRAKSLFQAQLSGYASVQAVAETVTRRYCEPLTNPRLTDLGLHRQGSAWWIVLAEPFTPPPPSAAADVAARVLALTNQARSTPRKCGDRPFEAAGPVRPSALLARAAAAHAQDMARHGVLRHEGSDGSEASQRLTRAGYRWRSMGENVASGQTTPEQVVQEWLQSPGHCAALMNPRFSEMGVAYAVNMNSESGIYWAQEFGRPR